MIANRSPLSSLFPVRAPGPWKLFDALQSEVQSLLQSHRAVDPHVRMFASDDSLVIELDAPGLDAEAFEIAPSGPKLVIQLSASAASPEGARVLQEERTARPTRYELTLPFPVTAETLDAVYDKGILRVTATIPTTATARVAVRAG